MLVGRSIRLLFLRTLGWTEARDEPEQANYHRGRERKASESSNNKTRNNCDPAPIHSGYSKPNGGAEERTSQDEGFEEIHGRWDTPGRPTLGVR